MFKIVTDHQIITRDNRQQKSNYILSMIRGYFGCIFHVYTYVVGYSFITVVHILQHSITRYNIYNPTAREIRGKGRIFSWSILLIFLIQYCVRHRNTKIFPFFVLQTIIGRWKVRLSFVRSLF